MYYWTITKSIHIKPRSPQIICVNVQVYRTHEQAETPAFVYKAPSILCRRLMCCLSKVAEDFKE